MLVVQNSARTFAAILDKLASDLLRVRVVIMKVRKARMCAGPVE